ncbi:nitroreductase [Halioxenophilus sp. WMMB6]|uniref:nitroreductase n=1 Tax=Halioxenophilus sp. WMMB6 TaxID=3073815 RepID=UPI00295F4AEB|nr:nitroreductase [Halioxenophilus sp. WMMB6]
MNVTDAINLRKSIRAFQPDPIAKSDLHDLLTTAQRAPSGSNVQPWRVIAVTGQEQKAVTELAMQSFQSGVIATRPIEPPFSLNYEALDPIYLERSQQMGALMTEAAGIERSDAEGRQKLAIRNFHFFDAPVGLFFVLDKRFNPAQWGHTGMYLQTICLLAVERGWGTCIQEAWAMFRPELHRHFRLQENELVWCGMSLGVPDQSARANSYFTSRAPVEEVVSFLGFENQ